MDEIQVRLRPRRRVTWLWFALNPATKLIPALALGPRTQQTVHGLVHDLRSTLAPDYVPLVTTDGLRHYFYALPAHSGRWVTSGRRHRWEVDPRLRYGQVHKQYRRWHLVRVRRGAVCSRRMSARKRLSCHPSVADTSDLPGNTLIRSNAPLQSPPRHLRDR